MEEKKLMNNVRTTAAKGLLLLLCLLAAFAPATTWAAAHKPEDSASGLVRVREAQIGARSFDKWEQLVAGEAVKALLTFHISRNRMTPNLLTRWLDTYLDTLDPGRHYFTISDVDSFQKECSAISVGNGNPNSNSTWMNQSLTLAGKIYTRFLQRMKENVLYSADLLLLAKWDFTVNESLPMVQFPDHLPWCKNTDELKERWRLSVKNTILSDQLSQEEKKRLADEKLDVEKVKAEQATKSKKLDVRERNRRNLVRRFFTRYDADNAEVMEIFVNALASTLDPHSNYFGPEDDEEFDMHMSLKLQGIGAVLTIRESYITINSLIPGGPAARDGRLKLGDRILAVGQSSSEEPVDVVDMPLNKAVKMIRGPKGSEVFLTIQPEGSSSDYVLRLVRDEVQLKDSEASSKLIITPNHKRIQVIYLPSFYCDFDAKIAGDSNYRSCSRDVKRLLERQRLEGKVDGVILDLRGNGGGSLDEAQQLCALFLKGGPVVQCAGGYRRNPDVLRISAWNIPTYWGPLMVLVDRGSASASEITAACLQDTHRAIVVGDQTTFGKGSVQSVFPLEQYSRIRDYRDSFPNRKAGALKVTLSKFYRINGGATQERGVVPDVIFPSFTWLMGYGEAKMPNVLPWDEIKPCRGILNASYVTPEKVKALNDFAGKYMAENPDFKEYNAELERYKKFRDLESLPLEINARRQYNQEELNFLRQLRRFTPDRTNEDQPRLKDEDEELLEAAGKKKCDIILQAAVALFQHALTLEK